MARKRSKDVIPKKIGGVKMPKEVRSGRFGKLLASKAGQALIVEAILGASAVVAGMKAKDSPKARKMAGDAKHKLADAGAETAGKAGLATSTLAYALGEAARSFTEALHRGEPRASAKGAEPDTAWTPDYGAPEPGPAKRKKPAPPLAGGPH
jgi:hypothetical protein